MTQQNKNSSGSGDENQKSPVQKYHSNEYKSSHHKDLSLAQPILLTINKLDNSKGMK